MKNTIKLILLCLFISTTASAQGFLNKLKKKTADKISQKAEQKLVDELSEELANRAVKPIDSVMDSMFKESYEKKTGEKYDPEDSEAMNAFFENMFTPVELPEKYEFNYIMEVEISDSKEKDEYEMTLFISDEQSIFGIEQENDGEKMMMVFDGTNEAMITYNKKEKKLMAISLNSEMMSMFGKMAKSEADKEGVFQIEKTGKTKKILGYLAHEWEYEMGEYESEAYISEEVPFNWDDSYGQVIQQFVPDYYSERDEAQMKGMLLESRTINTEENSMTRWETKKIKKKKTKIDNSKYEQTNPGSY